MITRIEAYRYRCFQKLDLPVGSYQVLVGKNGAGKSTLLDIPVLLGEILALRNIHDAFFKPTRSHVRQRADTPAELLFAGSGEWFAFAIETRLPERIASSLQRATFETLPKREKKKWEQNPSRAVGHARYEIGMRLVAGALEVFHEFLYLLPQDMGLVKTISGGLWGENYVEDDRLVRCVIRRTTENVSLIRPESPSQAADIRAEVPRTAPALSGVPLDISLYAACNWLRDFLSEDSLPVMLDWPTMRKAQLPPGRNYKVAPNGITLPWSVMDLAKEPDHFAEWLVHIQSALPLLVDIIGRTTEDAGLAFLEATYENGLKVRSSGLSDGTLSILALSIFPYLRNVPGFVTVEEPENGIHPKAIEAVLESLSRMPDSQVWISTHSPVAVFNSEPAQLLCLRQTKADGVQVVRGSEHPLLAQWQGTPSLATLQAAGVL